MNQIVDAMTIQHAIEETLGTTYPKYRNYWQCRTPTVIVHPDWLGSNWTWAALAQPGDLQLIGYAAEQVRKWYPRASL